MNHIASFLNRMDSDWMTEHIINLYRLERKQTFPYYQKAAQYVYDLLKEEGFATEFLDFPADGKTAYQDKCMPIGWDVSEMRLKVISDVPGLKDPVIADYSQNPISVVKHSVATPREGIITRLVTENQMKHGESVDGAFVLLNPSSRPYGTPLKMLLDLGAVGWVSDFHEEGIDDDLDAVYWVNAGTEDGNWHVIAEDRDFIGFSISPRNGYYLRQVCEKGAVKVHAVSDGRRYETILPAVTALLPGEDPREIWVLSHLYEPLIDDNSSGVISSIAILKALRDLQQEGMTLRYSVRVVFASEMYGFSAVAEYFGGDLSQKCIGAINTDGIFSSFDKSAHKEFQVNYAPNLPGFVGNLFLDQMAEKILEVFPGYTFFDKGSRFADDMFLSDATTGLPTVWLFHTAKGYHHHSTQDEDLYDPNALMMHSACNAEWIRTMAAATEEEIRLLLPRFVTQANERLQKLAREKVRSGTDLAARMAFLRNREQSKILQLHLYSDSVEIDLAAKSITEVVPANFIEDIPTIWLDYSENFVFTREVRGFPKDLVRVPKGERFSLPDGVTYGNFADVLARMDGQKTFRQILEEVQWDLNLILPEKTVKNYLHLCIRLANYGYLSFNAKNTLYPSHLTQALKALGVKNGDTILVHSAMSNFGYLVGGTDGMIQAISDAVGEDGTFLAPAFARPYIYFEGTLNKNYTYRPYDTRPKGHLRDAIISTGNLPKTMLQYPGSARSGHVSHEWVAIGGHAEECVAGHGLLDDPASEYSPMKHVLDRNGSVVFLGCDVNCNTFIHFIEHVTDAAFLHPALVTYLDEEGTLQSAYIRKHLGGCRDFYKGRAGYFYQEAIRRGLTIYEQPFGLTKIYRIELKQLYEIGCEIYRGDIEKLLCGNDGCYFCKRYIKK